MKKEVTAERTLKLLNKRFAEDLSKLMGQDLDDITLELSKSQNPEVVIIGKALEKLDERQMILIHIGLLLAALKPEAINAAKMSQLEEKFGKVLEKSGEGKAAAALKED